MDKIKENEIDGWIKGVKNEIAYWENAVEAVNFNENERELILEGVEEAELKEILCEENPLVLDVGCGLSYKYGEFFKKKKLDLQRIDPLAVLYNKILFEKDKKIPLIKFAMVEYLYAFYKKSTVSLIIISNALDHSYNPIKGIESALQVLKKGGMLYLFHYENEAESEHYHGFHQFNFTIKKKEMICWNKKGEININKKFGEFANIETIKINEKIICKIIKKKEMELNERSEDVLNLCEQLIYAISKFVDLKFIITYTSKFLFLKMYTKIKKISPRFFTHTKNIIRKIPIVKNIEKLFK